MSVRRRPSLWSYFSFTTYPIQKIQPEYRYGRSVISNFRHNDPYENKNRHKKTPSSSRRSSRPFKRIMGSMAQSGRARLMKIVGVVVLVLLGCWAFLPMEGKVKVEDVIGAKYAPTHQQQQQQQQYTEHTVGQTPSNEASGTPKCKKSSHSTKPIVQYALMIDAGSQGSRIHVYKFNNCGETPELEHETFKNIEPGLSSYKDDAEAAAKSLDVLLDVAVKEVPDSLKTCTPLAVKATAGLRLLGSQQSEAILAAVKHRLETKYPFPVVKDGVSIMDGKDEGVYAWITTNYLLGKIGTIEKIPTAAIFDLGGASTQIVFEPSFPSASGGMPEKLKEGDHKYILTFGGREFHLYQHSHLGYGLKEARKAIFKSVFESARQAAGDSFSFEKQIVNPCIAPGMEKTVNVTVDISAEPPHKRTYEVNFVGPPEASTAQCRAIAESILHKDKDCVLTPCSFNGVHQPSLERTFAREDIYVFSYFYDRIKPLGMPNSFSIAELKELAAKVCRGKEGWGSFTSTVGTIKELESRPEHCLDLNFMIALLHTGYEMPIDRELKIAKKIKGNELGWCLGASLPLLEQGAGGWQCHIVEVS